MCKFTRTIHVCGHDQYVLKKSCEHFLHDTTTNTPSCTLIKTQVGPPPSQFIAGTISYPLNTCGTANCTYTPILDPFLPGGAVVQVPPGSPINPRDSSWNTPSPLATRFRGALGRVSRLEAKIWHSNSSMLSVGSKQLSSATRPYSQSPPSLDDEMIGKQSLYDELLPHRSELSSDDDLAVELLLTNHNPRPKRHRNHSSSDFATPPPPGHDPKHKKQRIEDTGSVMAREMVVLAINPAAQMMNTDERMELELEA